MSSGFVTSDNTGAMCCLCFSWTQIEELAVDHKGTKWDLCMPCARLEMHSILFSMMAGRKYV